MQEGGKECEVKWREAGTHGGHPAGKWILSTGRRHPLHRQSWVAETCLQRRRVRQVQEQLGICRTRTTNQGFLVILKKEVLPWVWELENTVDS